MTQMSKKVKWYEDENDLANKRWFTPIWFGFWVIGLIFGIRHIELFHTWIY